MGRHRKGWQLRAPRNGREVWTVRWWDGDRTVERSTGERTEGRAGQAAARLYAAAVRDPAPSVARGRSGNTREAAAQWLASLHGALAPGTVETWTVYARGFVEWFPTLADLVTPRCAEFVSLRLREVRAATVRKESTALRSFIRWAHERGHIGWDVTVPAVPRGALGTPHHQRRRTKAPPLSPAECKRILKALPEWSRTVHGSSHPVRARFVVAYWTGLRPSTLDRLTVPTHYAKGRGYLALTDDVDKARWGRRLPLAPEARRALDRVCPSEGVIFGHHDYREHLAKAAAAVLDPQRAAVFTGAHLRSARATHLCEGVDALNLPGVQYALGHRLLSTTAGYIEPSLRAAEAVLAPKRNRERRRK